MKFEDPGTQSPEVAEKTEKSSSHPASSEEEQVSQGGEAEIYSRNGV
jgi:hypothetical protein